MTHAKDPFYRRAIKAGSALTLAAIATVGMSLAPANAQGTYDRDHGYYDHDRDRDDYNQNDRPLNRNDLVQVAALNGYGDGYEHGLQDRRNRQGFNYQHDETYRQATEGFNGRWGNLGIYQSTFRQYYAQGYSDAFYGRERSRNYYDRGTSRYRYNRNGTYVDPSGGYYGYNRGTVGGSYGNTAGSYNYPSYGNTAGTYNNYPSYGNGYETGALMQRAQQYGYNDGLERGRYDRSIGARVGKPTGHGAYEFALNGWTQDDGYSAQYQQTYRQSFVQGYWDGFNGRR